MVSRFHAESAPAKVDYNRDVRPILSENCYACHGPDEGKRKAGLRLDRKDDAFKRLKSEAIAIVPGNPSKSELLNRVTTKDEDDRMPPAKSGKALSPAQIDLLQKWIEQGAEWKGHWAYLKPERPPVPEVKNKAWPRNEIDFFILARLEKEALKPSPEADKSRLIRRLSLDLTGLPPSLAEVEEFLYDNSPEAYEKLVDRLLGSPQYGERMAQFWLDLARYADTNGYHIDNHRDNWKWREWVIEAFNRNLPFDQFSIQQLAGDLLPNPSLEQRIASGFNRNNMHNFEGGADPDEYQTKYVVDRVDTTATVWLGTTMACTECHDHKYDPFTQKEFYQFYAFFNTIAERGLDGQVQSPAPRLALPLPEQKARLEQFDKEIAGIEAGRKSLLETPKSEWDKGQAGWERKFRGIATDWTTLEPLHASSAKGATLTNAENRAVLVAGASEDKDTYEITLRTQIDDITGIRLEALPHESLPGKGAGRGEKGNFVLTTFEVEANASSAAPNPDSLDPPLIGAWYALGPFQADSPRQAFGKAFIAESQVDLKKTYEEGGLKWVKREDWTDGAVHALQGENSATYLYRVLTAHQAQQIMALIGSGDGVQVWLNGKRIFANDIVRDVKTDQDRVRLRLNTGENKLLLKISNAAGSSGFAFALSKEAVTKHAVDFERAVADFNKPGFNVMTALDDQPATGWSLGEGAASVNRHAYFLSRQPFGFPEGTEIKVRMKFESARPRSSLGHFRIAVTGANGLSEFAALPDNMRADLVVPEDKLTPPQQQELRTYYRETFVDEVKSINKVLADQREARTKFDRSIPSTMVMQEMEKPRETHILIRGDFRNKGEKVEPGVPSVLPPLPAGAPANRLALARWLSEPDHPLVSRVTVNRFWQMCFGTGLVKTANDFGSQGEWPSHPELLDWLATEFIRSKWDIKAFQKLIVMSATYRQSSQVTPDLLEKDPDNRLLARAPRLRLEAEFVRDNALAIAGVLNRKMGGESVRPYQPAGLWEAIGFTDNGNFSSQAYTQSKGDDNYRRGLYVYWKRSLPYASFVTFDAPNREVCTVKRPRTNTPLQALVMMNDPVYVEAARCFAQRIIREGGASAAQRVAYAFRLAVARPPTRLEEQILLSIYEKQLEKFQNDKAAAMALVTIGESQPPFGLDPAELAAWTAIGNVILNLDETITKG
ncbi:MAG: PSD1 domain-containing protein [Verrucomicrobia bacterium]|nr:PSD1 domain-containing protein [Verrucomicrobiota bacterium]